MSDHTHIGPTVSGGDESGRSESRDDAAPKPYHPPRLEILGEVATITMGSPGTFLESGQSEPSKA